MPVVAIVAVLWPALVWVNRRSWAPRFRSGASIGIFLLGALFGKLMEATGCARRPRPGYYFFGFAPLPFRWGR